MKFWGLRIRIGRVTNAGPGALPRGPPTPAQKPALRRGNPRWAGAGAGPECQEASTAGPGLQLPACTTAKAKALPLLASFFPVLTSKTVG